MGHLAHAIHVARHDVAAQTVVGSQGFFEIDAAGFGICTPQPGGFVQRLSRDVNGELALRRVDRSHRHAGPVERNAVSQANVVKVIRRASDGQPFAMG